MFSHPVTAWIGLGANLGEDPAGALRAAIAALDELPQTRLVAASSLYRTAPIGCAPQPDYFNAVAQVSTTLTPRALLEALLAIEQHFGRQRSYQNAPRTLDLDLLLYGDVMLHEHGLTVPHPRLHQRAFVLVPLAELAPDLDIRGQGRVSELLAGVADQRIERMES